MKPITEMSIAELQDLRGRIDMQLRLLVLGDPRKSFTIELKPDNPTPAALPERYMQLIDVANDALEFIQDQEDVVDGSYGEQHANQAMQIASRLREILDAAVEPPPKGK